MKLLLQALIKFIAGLILVGILLFLPAGTLYYANGWLFMGLLFVPMLILGVVLYLKAPALLARRLSHKETQKAQKWVVGFSGIVFTTGFVVAGLDHRFGWSSVPSWVVVFGAVILLVAYALYGEVMRENAYLSRTIEVAQGQQVVDTGLYGIVRHPMYAVTLWLFLAFPVVLGSWWALLCFSPYVIIIVVRIVNEEKVLMRDLVGYETYRTRVRYRLFPYIW